MPYEDFPGSTVDGHPPANAGDMGWRPVPLKKERKKRKEKLEMQSDGKDMDQLELLHGWWE